jgi:hypothetical protein
VIDSNYSFIEERLRKAIKMKPMGDTQIYDFCAEYFNSHDEIVKFMVHIGYRYCDANKIPWKRNYQKNYYTMIQRLPQLNSANKI